MKIDRKTVNRQLTWISLLAITSIACGLKVLEPAEAKHTPEAALIDAEWENCLRTHFEKRLFNFIDATDDQQKNLDALFKNRMEETRPVREKLKVGLVELAKLFASADATDEQIQEKAKQLKELNEELAGGRITTALKIRNILDPDQRKLVSDRLISRLCGNERQHFLKGL
jgi:Spy/CpxP family protein refolding chaperone